MTVGNTLFTKRASHLVSYESGPSKAQVNYRLVRRNQRKFLKDLESYLVKFVSPGISHWYAILR